jgi:hypothetical protein
MLWWDYVAAFEDKCAGSVNTWNDACSNTILSSLKIDHNTVDACIANSGGLTTGENTLLEGALSDRDESGVFYLPTVYINNQAYRGSLDCPDMSDGVDVDINQCGVLEAICTGYASGTAPDLCYTASSCPLGVTHRDACGVCGGTTTDEDKCSEGGSPFPIWAIFFIVVTGIGAVAAGVYCYMLRQQNVMRDDIDALLKRYLPLEEGGHSMNHPMNNMGTSSHDPMNSFA